MNSRLFTSSLRASSARTAPKVVRTAPRRNIHATSSLEGNRAGNKEWPWILGSAVVFVPALYYLVGKSALKHGDNIAKDADTSRSTTAKIHEAEGTAGKDEGVTKATPTGTGDSKDGVEGEISHEELHETIEKELKADAPKTAYKAEEEKAKK